VADVPAAEAGALGPDRPVGFVGLGTMGGPMAARLAAAGWTLQAFDTAAPAREAFTARTGVAAAAGLAEAVAGAAAVVLMLPDSNVVAAVAGGGLLDGLAPGALVVDMSSSEPTATQGLAGRVAAAGGRMVDAPVSGGVRGAEAGTLTVMVGGADGDVADARPLLEALGGRVTHVGPVGAGHAVKALNNLLSAVHLLASVEAVQVAERFGLDPATVVDVVNASTGRSASTEVKLPQFILPGTFDSGFALALLLKDARTAAGLARELGMPLSLADATVAAWADAAEALPEGADHTEIARWVTARGASTSGRG
jgi:3-hydroxyisobutyrate dehydrogenase